MTRKNDKPKTKRNPVLMILASVILAFSGVMVYLGAAYFQEFGWLFSSGSIIIGLVEIMGSIAVIVTGKAEYLMLDIIFPS